MDRSSSLELLATVCTEVSELVADHAALDEVRRLRRRLDEPVRLAVVGPAGAGASTLVNAIVGARVSPTGPFGDTPHPLWLRGSAATRAAAVLHDGTVVEVPFELSGGLALDLAHLDAGQIARLEVGWPAPSLTDLTIVDAVPSAAIHADTDAVLLVIPDPEIGHDTLAALGLESTPSPINTITVVTRADDVNNGRPEAVDRVLEALPEPARRSTLVVVGLVAEATHTLTSGSVDALRALAALPRERTIELMRTADRLVAADEPAVSGPERAELVRELGLYGVRTAVGALQERPDLTDADLRAVLRVASGIDRLVSAIRTEVVGRADALRVASVVNGLRSIARGLSRVDERRGFELERLVQRTVPSLPEESELRVLHLAMTGQLPLSEGDVDDLRCLWSVAPLMARLGLAPDASRPTAQAVTVAAIARWRERGDDMFATPELRDACDTIARTYEAIFQQLEAHQV